MTELKRPPYTKVMTPQLLASLRVALGCALAGHDDDWYRVRDLLEPLNKRELREVASWLAALAAKGRDAREHRGAGACRPRRGCPTRRRCADVPRTGYEPALRPRHRLLGLTRGQVRRMTDCPCALP